MGEIARARRMRKALTPPEARLWIHLRKLRAAGFHFRRQAPVRGYYLDFVCFSRRLIVEVDGRGHEFGDRPEHDRIRDGVMAREGFRTLRFGNEAVRDNLDGVLVTVREALEAALPTRPLRGHPPQNGEGED